MAETSTTWLYLAPNPKSAYKQLFVKGTRLQARILYGLYKSATDPMTPDEIATDYALPLDAVREAIAYCETNPPEIAEDFAAEEALLAAVADGSSHRKLLTPQELAQLGRP